MKNLAGFVETQQPARRIERAEHSEQPDIDQPQRHANLAQSGDRDRELVERQGQNPGSHGHGEPVGRELADDFWNLGFSPKINWRDAFRFGHGAEVLVAIRFRMTREENSGANIAEKD